MKMAVEVNTTVIEMKGIILVASINNWTTNTTNIIGISENLQYMIQSNIEDWVFQIQRILADELDRYKGQGNVYVDKNIQEIQELYMNEEQKKTGTVQDDEIILIKPYKVDNHIASTSSKSSSFIDKEINNLIKYMKFVKSST